MIARRDALIALMMVPSTSVAQTTSGSHEIVKQVFTPAAFGARGDGQSDDTAALRQMLAAMNSGDTAEFGSGVYLIRPDVVNDYILPLPDVSGITVRGTSRTGSVIRIAPNSGNYLGIFGRRQARALGNVTVTQLTIDHNQGANPQDSLSEYKNRGRYTLSNYPPAIPPEGFVFDDVDVLNCDSVVSVYLPQNEQRGGTNVVRNCRWLGLSNARGENFDQSIINIAGDQLIVMGNTFRGSSWGRGCPRTCIETHSSNQTIVGNTISQAQVGMNLSGISRPGVDRNIVCTGNIVNVSHDGIVLWSNYFEKYPHPVGLDGAVIANNQIRLNPDLSEYNRRSSRAIAIFGGSRAATIRNTKIMGNQIIYPDNAAYYAQQNMSDIASGIGWTFKSADTEIDDLTIEDNTIINAPSSSISGKGGRVRSLAITGNTLVNPAIANKSRRSMRESVAIFVSSAIDSPVPITGNTIRIASTTGPVALFHLQDEGSRNGGFNLSGNSYVFANGIDYLMALFTQQSRGRFSFFETVPLPRGEIDYPALDQTSDGEIRCSTNRTIYYPVPDQPGVWLAERRGVGQNPYEQPISGDVVIAHPPRPDLPFRWVFNGRDWQPSP